MGSQSASIATSMVIWPRNVGERRKKKQESASNATKRGTLQRIAKESNQ